MPALRFTPALSWHAMRHGAPRFAARAEGATRGRHEWCLEARARAGTALAPLAMAESLDHELQRRNEDYEAKRRRGGLGLPLLRIVAAGTFEGWLWSKGKWGGQGQIPRCRSERVIADELPPPGARGTIAVGCLAAR